jgi:mannose-6-phosphate isomerase-like protein (cupin superfamily)
MNNKETRPWGWFSTIEEGINYKVKKLFVKRDCRISLQSHNQRDEHWVIVSGSGVFMHGDSVREPVESFVKSGDYLFVPKFHKHRITALEDLTLIEVQMGVCDEADIIRYQDDYGRK